MGSQAQREATEMDEAELANMPELDAPQADEMVENSLFENAASGKSSLDPCVSKKNPYNHFKLSKIDSKA